MFIWIQNNNCFSCVGEPEYDSSDYEETRLARDKRRARWQKGEWGSN